MKDLSANGRDLIVIRTIDVAKGYGLDVVEDEETKNGKFRWDPQKSSLQSWSRNIEK